MRRYPRFLCNCLPWARAYERAPTLAHRVIHTTWSSTGAQGESSGALDRIRRSWPPLAFAAGLMSTQCAELYIEKTSWGLRAGSGSGWGMENKEGEKNTAAARDGAARAWLMD